MTNHFSNDFDHDNDTQANGYFLYKNKLINARTYELLIEYDIKILLPVNFDMNRKNRILQNRKNFQEYKLNFKEFQYVDGFNSLLSINKAYQQCEDKYQITTNNLNAVLTLFCFQIFTKQDMFDVLNQSGFKFLKSTFIFLDKNNFILRVDTLSKLTKVNNRVYAFSEKGIALVKMFYDVIEQSSVSDFKFKSKKDLLVDNLLKKYENG
jgi:hypothetical protein